MSDANTFNRFTVCRYGGLGMDVMTNKSEMVSVPRELLERIVQADFTYGAHGSPSYGFTMLDELHDALESAPAEDVCAVVDEPVAWVLPAQIEAMKDVGWMHAFRDQGRTGTEIALYRRPQRQVVMPKRKKMPELMLSTWHEAQGWNACLDEVARLNPEIPK